MLQLKELRQIQGFTQGQLADMLKTTQQTIARWEAGKSEPNLSALRDLAVIFGTSVDDLLGTNPISRKLTTNLPFYASDNECHFWGHLGILLPGEKHTRWYPITLEEAKRVGRLLINATPDDAWLAIPTLNNRMLVLNCLSVQRIYIRDDNADEVTDDDVQTFGGGGEFPLELYRGLADWYLNECQNYSDVLKEWIHTVINAEELTSDRIFELVFSTYIHYRDGSAQSIAGDDERLWDVVQQLTYEQPRIFDLTAGEKGLEIYIPAAAAHMIDMPLIQVVDGGKQQAAVTAREDSLAREKSRRK
ncbi:helix-turn-helix transcriptional regulator [Uliginosibacterium sp. 31-12]|uniref:helix-turn-helix transcriptional regulator n=1 Tax=Uliginosibacterium sp. 31-12 TaxID=3062781 RepID=UPI0026E1394C|nr:helix-turn-helix transcriptional regulator [Uliginosibacterium sp. 31-12]MDO6385274.1 helix-turn-helix transcriptional regulator [Uliginosibacterium sp. 31-12]